MAVEASLSSLVRHRARRICEYCRLPEAESDLPFVVDHIIARQHGGTTIESNLALACPCCNLHKGPNIAGIDPENGNISPLFHPRLHRWTDHFQWEGVVITPVTPIGRTTLVVLAMNDSRQIAVRRVMLATGWLLRSDS
jgi:hypothetical protein